MLNTILNLIFDSIDFFTKKKPRIPINIHNCSDYNYNMDILFYHNEIVVNLNKKCISKKMIETIKEKLNVPEIMDTLHSEQFDCTNFFNSDFTFRLYNGNSKHIVAYYSPMQKKFKFATPYDEAKNEANKKIYTGK